METKELIKQFVDLITTRDKEYEKKQIKLRRVNIVKFCPICKEFAEIVMKEQDGFCDKCEEKLYTIKNNKKR
jgi:ribosomal protein L33